MEFLSVSGTREALSTILEYFKEKNQSWEKIEAFIIDKDFAEWGALEQLFPSAMVSKFPHGLILFSLIFVAFHRFFCASSTSYRLLGGR